MLHGVARSERLNASGDTSHNDEACLGGAPGSTDPTKGFGTSVGNITAEEDKLGLERFESLRFDGFDARGLELHDGDGGGKGGDWGWPSSSTST